MSRDTGMESYELWCNNDNDVKLHVKRYSYMPAVDDLVRMDEMKNMVTMKTMMMIKMITLILIMMILPYCHIAILSYCHFAILPYCHIGHIIVILPYYWDIAILVPIAMPVPMPQPCKVCNFRHRS